MGLLRLELYGLNRKTLGIRVGWPFFQSSVRSWRKLNVSVATRLIRWEVRWYFAKTGIQDGRGSNVSLPEREKPVPARKEGKTSRGKKNCTLGTFSFSVSLWKQDLRMKMPCLTKVHHPMRCRLGARNMLSVPPCLTYIILSQMETTELRTEQMSRTRSSLPRGRNHRPRIRYKKYNPIKVLFLISHSCSWLNVNLLKTYQAFKGCCLVHEIPT